MDHYFNLFKNFCYYLFVGVVVSGVRNPSYLQGGALPGTTNHSLPPGGAVPSNSNTPYQTTVEQNVGFQYPQQTGYQQSTGKL